MHQRDESVCDVFDSNEMGELVEDGCTPGWLGEGSGEQYRKMTERNLQECDKGPNGACWNVYFKKFSDFTPFIDFSDVFYDAQTRLGYADVFPAITNVSVRTLQRTLRRFN